MADSYKIFYRACSHTFAIHETLVQKATAKSVWLVSPALFEGEKDIIKAVSRKTSYDEYFETLEAAKSFLAPRLEKKIKRIKQELQELEQGVKVFKLREHKPLDKRGFSELFD